MAAQTEKRLPDINVDAEALVKEEVIAMDKAPLPDPNTQIDAFMDEAWRRQCIREMHATSTDEQRLGAWRQELMYVSEQCMSNMKNYQVGARACVPHGRARARFS